MIHIRQDRLREHPHQVDQIAILEAALASVEPAALMAAHVSVTENMLAVGEMSFPLEGRCVWILAIGKAAVPMAQAAESILGLGRIADGIALTRAGQGAETGIVRVIESGHPLPEGTEGADAVAALSARVNPKDLVLCLLSGGGSALLASPPAGVSIAELARTTKLLLHSGATIDEINTVRRHVSRLQGGQLMALLQPATVVTLILSDVLGDRLESIASGPTVPDPSSYADAYDVLHRYDLWEVLPESIRQHLLSGVAGNIPETPKSGVRPFDTAHTVLLGNNATAVDALCSAARSLGFDVHKQSAPLIGEARDVGSRLADQALSLASKATTKWALVAGGETTVTIRGDGLGGRNQEMALAASLWLEGIPGISLAALGTDGTDGPTEAAGALVDGQTVVLTRRRGLDPEAALAQNDSHELLDVTQDLLWTGPTRTNVADLVLVLGMPRV